MRQNSLKTLRISTNLTQIQFAEKCGWPNGQGRIAHYETGRRTPGIDDARIIIAVFHSLHIPCSLDDLWPVANSATFVNQNNQPNG